MKKYFVVVTAVFLCMSAVCVYFSRQASRGFVVLYQYEHDGEYGKTLHDQNGNVVYEFRFYPADTEWETASKNFSETRYKYDQNGKLTYKKSSTRYYKTAYFF